jgi:Fe-S-cluster containining protein
MNIEEKKKKLQAIYNQYEKDVSEFKKAAACVIGCADCCIDVGKIDITTLEGIIIYKQIALFEEPLKSEIKVKLIQNKTESKERKFVRCAFLKEDNSCLIYQIRPFSCRQLYSVKKCNGASPTIHRRALELTRQTIKRMQQLDSNGYSGHISYILYLMDDRNFRESYLRGRFEPQKIAGFSRSHNIFINRFVSQ